MHALDDKAKVMLDYKAPTSITELRSCLGLFSYYRRFIKYFAAIAAPLHALTKQERSGQSQRTLKKEANTTWSEGVWTKEQQKAFETLKGARLCRPVLVLPRKDRHWRLATDASIVAMGAATTTSNTQSVTIHGS